jgi:hypothetical protein
LVDPRRQRWGCIQLPPRRFQHLGHKWRTQFIGDTSLPQQFMPTNGASLGRKCWK